MSLKTLLYTTLAMTAMASLLPAAENKTAGDKTAPRDNYNIPL